MQKTVSNIFKGLVCGGEISLAVLDTTALVGEAVVRHGLSPVAAAALGRTMTAAAYLCSWLKEEKSTLHVTVAGDGAGGKISVSGGGDLALRGYIDVPDVELPLRADGKLDVASCVGKHGTLTVVRDDGEGIPFVGTGELVSGEIAEDFSAYFLYSEQRPTALSLGVLMNGGSCLAAGGVFLQPLPGASEEAISYAEQKIREFASVSRRIATEGIAGIVRSFGIEEKDGTVRPVLFRCTCSRERAASAILSMGKEDALALLKETGTVNVHCHDCNTDYRFEEQDILRLFDGRSNGR